MWMSPLLRYTLSIRGEAEDDDVEDVEDVDEDEVDEEEEEEGEPDHQADSAALRAILAAVAPDLDLDTAMSEMLYTKGGDPVYHAPKAEEGQPKKPVVKRKRKPAERRRSRTSSGANIRNMSDKAFIAHFNKNHKAGIRVRPGR